MSPFTDPLINTHASVRSDVFRPPSPRTCTLIPPDASRVPLFLAYPSNLVIPGTDAFSNTFLTVPCSDQLLDQANASLTISYPHRKTEKYSFTLFQYSILDWLDGTSDVLDMAAQLEAQNAYHLQPRAESGDWGPKTSNVSPVHDAVHYGVALHDHYAPHDVELESTPALDDVDGWSRRYSVASSQQSSERNFLPYSPLDPTDPTTVAYDRSRAEARRGSLPLRFPHVRELNPAPVHQLPVPWFDTRTKPSFVATTERRYVSYPSPATAEPISLRPNSCALSDEYRSPERSTTSTNALRFEHEHAQSALYTPPHSALSLPPTSAIWSRPTPVAGYTFAAYPADGTISNPSEAFQSWVPEGPADTDVTQSACSEVSPVRRASSIYSDNASEESAPSTRDQRQRTPFEIVGVKSESTILESMVTWTTDADVKQTVSIRRLCYNCQTKEPPSWRKSVLFPGRILCNKCGIYERTHRRPRPYQGDEEKLRKATIIQSTLRKPAFLDTAPSSASNVALPSWSRQHEAREPPRPPRLNLRTSWSNENKLGRYSMSPTIPESATYFDSAQSDQSYSAAPSPLEPSYEQARQHPHMNPSNFGPQVNGFTYLAESHLVHRGHGRGARSIAEPYAHAYVSNRRATMPSRPARLDDISRHSPYTHGRTVSLRSRGFDR